MNFNDRIPTRQSLLSRLKNWDDQESWRVFFETYWRLIYSAAVKAGLTDAEAQDVVQETVVSVMKSMPTFEYQTKKGSFKTWLMRLTGWRIMDELGRRQPEIEAQKRGSRTSTHTGTVERIAEPTDLGLEAIWDKEWETNLMEAAIDRVKRKVDGKQYQIFDLYVFKQWPVGRIARAFKIQPGKIYVTKHRIGLLVKKELANLRTKPI